MRFAYWITKAAGANSEYVMIIAFPRQKLFRREALIFAFLRKLPVLLHYVAIIETLSAHDRAFGKL